MKNTIRILLCIFAASIAAAAQDGSRSITSDDFVAQRPAAATAVKPKRTTYRFVRADRNVLRHKTPRKPRPAGADKFTEIGITMWRLRPRHGNESGYLLPVKGDKDNREMWLSERVPEDTVFKAGDRVRFAIESSTAGYLYVFDRETYADGSFGQPVMIFPEGPDGDNSVRPGMLFDIPDQREDLPYFNMMPRKPNYTGELLTIIVAPKPLTLFKTDNAGKLKNGDALSELEFGAQVEVFSRSDMQNKVFSKAEAESTCGVKTRELRRDKSDTPCGTGTRQLTRDEPLPQSIYRVKGPAGQPAVAFVKLAVK
jgi:hypothetical protein